MPSTHPANAASMTLPPPPAPAPAAQVTNTTLKSLDWGQCDLSDGAMIGLAKALAFRVGSPHHSTPRAHLLVWFPPLLPVSLPSLVWLLPPLGTWPLPRFASSPNLHTRIASLIRPNPGLLLPSFSRTLAPEWLVCPDSGGRTVDCAHRTLRTQKSLDPQQCAPACLALCWMVLRMRCPSCGAAPFRVLHALLPFAPVAALHDTLCSFRPPSPLPSPLTPSRARWPSARRKAALHPRATRAGAPT